MKRTHGSRQDRARARHSTIFALTSVILVPICGSCACEDAISTVWLQVGCCMVGAGCAVNEIVASARACTLSIDSRLEL
jgi:hypothetical protein